MSKKINRTIIGFIPGLLLPCITFFILYLARFSRYFAFGEFIKVMDSKAIFTPILSLCVLPNLLLFFAFIRLNNLKFAQGVLMATFIDAIIILLLKVLL